MSIPMGFWQGNRSEYLAIPALCKLGFTVPVPRQEDHFGVDFIVHLAKMVDQTVVPSGKSFGIQIKSNEEPLVFDKQSKRDCLYGSTLPFFLGVVNRHNLTLTVYNTLNRLHFFWMLGIEKDFTLVVDDGGDGIPKPDFAARTGGTGKPVLEIGLSEPATPQERLVEIEALQSTMRSWIDLENENLSLKEQGIALLLWPAAYAKNTPLKGDVEPIEMERFSYTKFAGPYSLPHICRATEKTLISLSFYLRKMPRTNVPADIAGQMDDMCGRVDRLRAECRLFRDTYITQCGGDAMMRSTHSWIPAEHPELPEA